MAAPNAPTTPPTGPGAGKPTPAKKPGVVGVIFNFLKGKDEVKATLENYKKAQIAQIFLKYDEVGAHRTIESLKAIGMTGQEITKHFDQAIEKVHAFRSAAQSAGTVMGFIAKTTVGLDNHMEALNKHFQPINNSFKELTNTAVNMRNAVGQGVSTESMVSVIGQASKYMTAEQKETLVSGKDRETGRKLEKSLESTAKGSESVARVIGGELGNDEQALAAASEMMVKYRVQTDLSDKAAERFGKSLGNIQKNSALSAGEFLTLNQRIADQAKGLGKTGDEAEQYAVRLNTVAAAASQVGLSLEKLAGGQDLTKIKMGDFGGLTEKMQQNVKLGLAPGENDQAVIARQRAKKATEVFKQLGVSSKEELDKKLSADKSGAFRIQMGAIAQNKGLGDVDMTELSSMGLPQDKKTLEDREKSITKSKDEAVKGAEQNMDSVGRKWKEVNEKVIAETTRAFQSLNEQLKGLTGILDTIVGKSLGTASKTAFMGGALGLGSLGTVGLGVFAGKMGLWKGGKALVNKFTGIGGAGSGAAGGAAESAAAAAVKDTESIAAKIAKLEKAQATRIAAGRTASPGLTNRIAQLEVDLAKNLETVKAGTKSMAPKGVFGKAGSKIMTDVIKPASQSVGKAAGTVMRDVIKPVTSQISGKELKQGGKYAAYAAGALAAGYGAYKLLSGDKKEGGEEEVPEEKPAKEESKKASTVWTLPGEASAHAAEFAPGEQYQKQIPKDSKGRPISTVPKTEFEVKEEKASSIFKELDIPDKETFEKKLSEDKTGKLRIQMSALAKNKGLGDVEQEDLTKLAFDNKEIPKVKEKVENNIPEPEDKSALGKVSGTANSISEKLNSIPMLITALAAPAMVNKIAKVAGKAPPTAMAGFSTKLFGAAALASLSSNILDTSKKAYGDKDEAFKEQVKEAESSKVGAGLANVFAGGDKTSAAYGIGAGLGTVSIPAGLALAQLRKGNLKDAAGAAALAIPEMGFNAAKLVSASAEASRRANVEGVNFEAQNKRDLVTQGVGREFRAAKENYEKVKSTGDPGKIKEAHVEMLSKQLAWQQQNRQLSKAENTKAELKKAGVSDAAIAAISEASKKRLYSDGTKEGFIAAIKELQTTEASNTSAQIGSKGVIRKVRDFFGPGAAVKPENFVMPEKDTGKSGPLDRIRNTDRKVADTPEKAKVKETVVEASKKAGIDPRLGLAVVERESNFNVNAQNPKSSAGGAWQTINSTANALGIKNKFDIAEQSEKSTKELAKYVKYFESHPEKMAEYNAKNRTQLNPSGMAMAAWHDGMPATLAGGRQDLEAVNYRNAAQRKTTDIGRSEYADAGTAIGQAVPTVPAELTVMQRAKQNQDRMKRDGDLDTSIAKAVEIKPAAEIAKVIENKPEAEIAKEVDAKAPKNEGIDESLIPASTKATASVSSEEAKGPTKMESPSIERILSSIDSGILQLLSKMGSQGATPIPPMKTAAMYTNPSNNLGSR